MAMEIVSTLRRMIFLILLVVCVVKYGFPLLGALVHCMTVFFHALARAFTALG